MGATVLTHGERCTLPRFTLRPHPGRPRRGQPAERRAAGGGGPRRPRGRHRAPVRRPGRAAARRAARHSIGWAREHVFIANVVKCRPPGNRDPEPDEISACSPLPRPPGGGPRPGGDRHPGPPLAAPLPARCPHRRGARPTAPIGRPLHFPDVPSCCGAAPVLAAGDALRRHAWTAGGAAGRSRGDRGRAGGIGPGDLARTGAPAPTASTDDAEQMTLF